MSQEFDIEKPTIVPEDIDTEAKNNDNNITVEELTVGVNEEKPLTSTAEVIKKNGNASMINSNEMKSQFSEKENCASFKIGCVTEQPYIVNSEASRDIDILYQAKQIVHTRKFKMHCNHLLSKDLDRLATNLLQDLVRFQDNKFAEDPVKAKARRRYVVGLREATKFMKVNKVVGLLLAPDIDNIESKGGLNDVIGDLMKMAANTGEFGEKKPVPVFFVMNRWTLKKATRRQAPISCVAVLNYHGSDQNFMEMLELLPDLKNAYQDKLNDALQKIHHNLTSTNTSIDDVPLDKWKNNDCDTINCDISKLTSSKENAKIDMINERMLHILRKNDC